jgi:hypothetical protein
MQGATADKELAVNQVISLYNDSLNVLRSAADIKKSAQMVFGGLRTEAVAETIKSVRDAEFRLAEVVRQTISSAQTLLKNAAERAMAAGLAVTAALIANASESIPPGVGRALLWSVVGGLVVFAAWSEIVEAPLVGLQLDKIEQDLNRASFVTEQARNDLKETPSLVSTRRRVKYLKHAPAALYLAGAVALALWGVPAIQ